MAIVKGGRLMLFVASGSTASPKSVAYATNHTLNITGDLSNTSNKDVGNPISGATWASSELNQMSWTCTSENLFSTDGAGNNFADLFDYMIAGSAVTVVLGIASGNTENVPASGWSQDVAQTYYQGKALINSLQLNAPMGDNASYTVEMTGVGGLSRVAAGTGG